MSQDTLILPPASVIEPHPEAAVAEPAWIRVFQGMAALQAVQGLFAVGTLAFMMIMLRGIDAQVAGYCTIGLFGIGCAGVATVGRERRQCDGRWAGRLLQLAAIVAVAAFCFGVLRKGRPSPDDPASEEGIETLVMCSIGILYALAVAWGPGRSRSCRAWSRVDAPISSP
jgi:hypothetical protein